VLFLSSRHMVALWFEGLSGFDGVACRTPFLPGARLSETGSVQLSMTFAVGRPQSRSPSLTGIPGFAVRDLALQIQGSRGAGASLAAEGSEGCFRAKKKGGPSRNPPR
jgi:hypothetical protein